MVPPASVRGVLNGMIDSGVPVKKFGEKGTGNANRSVGLPN
jgi:hypothetical protein